MLCRRRSLSGGPTDVTEEIKKARKIPPQLFSRTNFSFFRGWGGGWTLLADHSLVCKSTTFLVRLQLAAVPYKLLL